MKHVRHFLLCLCLFAGVSGACRKEYYTYNILPDGYRLLAGRWLRIESNNASYDGLVVEVSAEEKEGVVAVSPASAGVFPVGTVKWSNINRETQDAFTLNDLTDTWGIRNEALAVCIGADTLRIAVKSNGSYQTWVRLP